MRVQAVGLRLAQGYVDMIIEKNVLLRLNVYLLS